MRINKSETCNDFSVDLVQSDYGSAWILASPAIHLDITLTATYIRRTPQISMFRTLSELSPLEFSWPIRQRTAMTEKDSRYRTVLIVEDSEDARYFMRLELEQLGYRIVEAENGEKAVEVAERERPDIILMDLSLPVMDGIAATERIRSRDGFKTVPVIAVTAHQETDFRADAKAAGFDAYVTKPIDVPWLSELIEGLLV
jgi:two-component system cell cycle response regulator DivK